MDEPIDDETIDALEFQSTPRGRFFREEDPLSFQSWVRGHDRIELEIGSGKGLYLLSTAPMHPSTRYVGLELAAKYAWNCQEKVDRQELTNLRFYACDATAVVHQDVEENSIDAVHVYFPDPWWKSKHKKRRVLSESTLINIERILKPSGEFHFWTDVLDYYESTLELIDSVTTLRGPYYVSEPASSHDMDYRTHFERRTRRNGLPVYRSRYVKNEPA